MKKFSKLITENKDKITNRKVSAFINPVYWDDIIEPFVEHIESNVNYIFQKKTKEKLDELISLMEEDYTQNWIDEVYDGSQEMFFNVYKVKVDYTDIIECVQPLMDRTDSIEDECNFDWGAYNMVLSKLRFTNLEDLIEDVGDVHGKLQMLKVDFKISINTSSKSIDIYRDIINVDNYIINSWKNPWGEIDKDISRLREISIFIYNKDTVSAIDLM